jgi:hypothetical protein
MYADVCWRMVLIIVLQLTVEKFVDQECAVSGRHWIKSARAKLSAWLCSTCSIRLCRYLSFIFPAAAGLVARSR